MFFLNISSQSISSLQVILTPPLQKCHSIVPHSNLPKQPNEGPNSLLYIYKKFVFKYKQYLKWL